jgi:hypothetical protein
VQTCSPRGKRRTPPMPDNTSGRWDLIAAPWHLDEHIPDFPVPVGTVATIGPPLPDGRDRPEASSGRARLAIARHASSAPTARHAALRTRACRAARPATAQSHGQRRHESAPTHARPHRPRQQDARCIPRGTAAEHQVHRRPGNARRPRYPQATEGHLGPPPRARSAAAQHVRPAGAPRKRPSTRPAPALPASAPQPQAAAPGCERGTPPRPRSAGRNRRRGQA